MEVIKEDRASSSNDAGLWRKLLEKAKKGTTTESYFAANIVVENLPSSMFPKLGLPAVFLEHHREELTENITLEGPDGHTWLVMLGLSWDSKPCLMQGWIQFATDCNLAVNDQIVFFLLDNSHFQFRVFDSKCNFKPTVCGTSADIARTTLPQVKDPIQSCDFTTSPNIASLPSGNNNSGVATNVRKETHTTQDSPSGEKLGNQEPRVKVDDDVRVTDFNANCGEVVEGFQSAPPSDAEEDQACSAEKARNLNQKSEKTTGRGGDELQKPISDPFAGTLGTETIYNFMRRAETSYQETDGASVRKSKEPNYTREVLSVRKSKEPNYTREVLPVRKSKEPKYIPEVLPVKRARQAPADRSQPVFSSPSRTQQARGMQKTSSDDPDSRATKSDPPTWKGGNWHRHELTGSLAAKIAQESVAAETFAAKGARKAEADREGPNGGVWTARIAEAAIAAGMARKEAQAVANEGDDATAGAPASVPEREPVTRMPVETPKQALKGPTSIPASMQVTPMPVETLKQTFKLPASVPPIHPLTPMPVEAPKEAPTRVYKRPQPRIQPRNPPRIPPPPPHLFFSKRRPVTQQERLAALEEAQQYADASRNRVHVMQLTAAQVYFGKRLTGTGDFAKTMELPLKGFKEVTLYNRSGRARQVVWYGEDDPMGTGFGEDAWTNFVLDHLLEEGDVCVFELSHPQVSNIEVTVFPVVPLNPKPKKWKDHYTVDAPVVPTVVQPEAEVRFNHSAAFSQSCSFEKEDSEKEGKRRRLVIDLNSRESGMKSNGSEEDKSNEKGKRGMKETTTEG